MFEVLQRDGLARIGEFSTPHGTLETPALLPVVNPRFSTIAPRELHDQFGFEAIITNSYIIKKDVELKERALDLGLHRLLDFPGTIMTDSGTFQSHVYGEVDVGNLEMIEFQRGIGADIGTVLDVFTEPSWSKEETEEGVETTLQRIMEGIPVKGDMMLSGVIQGSLYPDLRQYCAEALSKVEVEVHPIGGVVPLLESYRFSDLVDVIVASKKGLNPSRPVHLFGAGHPMLFALASLLGCDMHDSASYAKFARDGRMMFVDGTSKIQDMKQLDCQCPACHSLTLEDLKAMKEEERADRIARHNLHLCQQEIRRVKRAIYEGTLWDLTERRCRAHPSLLNGLRRLKAHTEYLERYEPISRRVAFFYTGEESMNRPIVKRYERRLIERYPFSERTGLVEYEECGKPYSRFLSTEGTSEEEQVVVDSPFGPVPLELDEIYPVAQSLFPEIMDRAVKDHGCRVKELFRSAHNFGHGSKGRQEGETEVSDVTTEYDLDKVKAVVDYQFGRGTWKSLLDGEVHLTKSRGTGKIRTVSVDGGHVLSMRASDGFFTLKPDGARRLIESFEVPRFRVIVNGESVPFNREGKNVFCKFVVECDPDIRPMEEVIVVDESDDLVATGRAVLTRGEMFSFNQGMAVKIREGVDQ